MRYSVAVTLAVGSWCCTIVVANETTTFPGAVSEVSSPDGKYVVRNQDREGEPPNHTLILVDTLEKSERHLLDYDRHVGVLWAPDSARFFINDYRGSSESTCHVVDARTAQSTDVWQKLLREASLSRHVTGNHHLYVVCEGWPSEETVSVIVSGYGDADPAGFEIGIDYDLNADVANVRIPAPDRSEGGIR
jgi:hypothetical protein